MKRCVLSSLGLQPTFEFILQSGFHNVLKMKWWNRKEEGRESRLDWATTQVLCHVRRSGVVSFEPYAVVFNSLGVQKGI